MVKNIEFCYKNNKIGSFYFNKEDNTVHLTGYVSYYNESELLIAHINQRGEYDGYILNKIDDLYRIDYDGEYEKKIEDLFLLKKQFHPIFACKNPNEGLLTPLLEFSKKNKLLISADMYNNTITGFVKRYSYDTIEFKTVNENGICNGCTVINIDEVITFSIDTDYEQDINLLLKEKLE